MLLPPLLFHPLHLVIQHDLFGCVECLLVDDPIAVIVLKHGHAFLNRQWLNDSCRFFGVPVGRAADFITQVIAVPVLDSYFDLFLKPYRILYVK